MDDFALQMRNQSGERARINVVVVVVVIVVVSCVRLLWLMCERLSGVFYHMRVRLLDLDRTGVDLLIGREAAKGRSGGGCVQLVSIFHAHTHARMHSHFIDFHLTECGHILFGMHRRVTCM